MVKLCSLLFLRFLATPLRHPMNNKYHFRNISLVIWVQNSGKIVDKNIPLLKIFYFAHCLRLRDVKTFSFSESQILVPRGPASYLCPGARIFSRRPWIHSWPKVSTNNPKMCEQNTSYDKGIVETWLSLKCCRRL